ncbi:MAG: lysophospholipid acyltransferase family protein [Halothiobacillus sp.]
MRFAPDLAPVLWATYETIAMVLGLMAFAVLCLIWLPFAWILGFVSSGLRGRRIGRWFIHLGFRLYLGFLRLFCANRFDLSALDTLKTAPPRVLVANHPSLLDALLIVSRLPNVVCVMKAGLMNNILFGAAARRAGYIRNDGPLEMILQADAALKEGAHVLIFPEGGRTQHFPLDVFGKSAALIAKRADVSIQTVLIKFSSPYLGKQWPLWRRPTLPLRWSVRLGPCFETPREVIACTKKMETTMRQQLGASE